MAFDFKTRIAHLRKSLKKDRLDAFVTVVIEGNNKNPYYLSGFGGTTGALVVSRKSAVLAVDSRYTLRAEKETKGVRVIEIPRGTPNPDFSLYVKTALSGASVSGKARVGFEGTQVPTLMHATWKKEMRLAFVPTRGLVEKLRQVKDAEELRHLARAGRVTSKVFEDISKTIREGQRECDIAARIDVALREAGALGNSFQTIVASGSNAAIPHHETSMRKVKAGETVVLDFGGIFPGGYCSDITRTLFVPGKKPKAELIHIYTIVREANRKALRALRPGMTWKEYDAVARTYITEAGYGKYFTHGLGHSIGLEAHDPYAYARDAFVVGTVVSNEPGIYLPHIGGVRIEDDLVVTKNGARNLTPAPYLSL